MTADRVTWLGHATILVELEGARLLTDPLMRQRVAHLRRQLPDPEPTGVLDAVLLSHRHHDHLDLPSLAVLDPNADVIAPRGAARSVRGTGRTVIALAAGERCCSRDIASRLLLVQTDTASYGGPRQRRLKAEAGA